MRKIVLLLLCLLTFNLFLQAGNYPRSVQKRIDKTLMKLFKKKDIVLNEIEISTDISSIYSSLRGVKVSVLKSGDLNLGYACFTSSKGKNDYFDYMVIFDTDLSVKLVKVLIYRSTYGGEIMSRSWLKQFIGKREGKSMEMDKDIDSISGATLSAPSITDGVKDLSVLIFKIKEQESVN